MTRLALILSLALTACTFLDHGGDDAPPVCNGIAEGAPAFESRDPQTGICQFIGTGGGGGECSPECPCPAEDTGVGHVAPNWPMCDGPCAALDEHACLASDTCHAAYSGNVAADQIAQFSACWDIAPIPVVSGGQCMGLDAWSCAEHPDCASFLEVGDFSGSFSYCGAAPSTTLDPGTCSGDVHCNLAPPACPVDTVPGVKGGCWSGYCIPTSACSADAACETLTEASCKLRQGECTPVYTGMNCTCTPDGTCTCESETFDRCDSLGRL